MMHSACAMLTTEEFERLASRFAILRIGQSAISAGGDGVVTYGDWFAQNEGPPTDEAWKWLGLNGAD